MELIYESPIDCFRDISLNLGIKPQFVIPFASRSPHCPAVVRPQVERYFLHGWAQPEKGANTYGSIAKKETQTLMTLFEFSSSVMSDARSMP